MKNLGGLIGLVVAVLVIFLIAGLLQNILVGGLGGVVLLVLLVLLLLGHL